MRQQGPGPRRGGIGADGDRGGGVSGCDPGCAFRSSARIAKQPSLQANALPNSDNFVLSLFLSLSSPVSSTPYRALQNGLHPHPRVHGPAFGRRGQGRLWPVHRVGRPRRRVAHWRERGQGKRKGGGLRQLAGSTATFDLCARLRLGERADGWWVGLVIHGQNLAGVKEGFLARQADVFPNGIKVETLSTVVSPRSGWLGSKPSVGYASRAERALATRLLPCRSSATLPSSRPKSRASRPRLDLTSTSQLKLTGSGRIVSSILSARLTRLLSPWPAFQPVYRDRVLGRDGQGGQDPRVPRYQQGLRHAHCPRHLVDL